MGLDAVIAEIKEKGRAEADAVQKSSESEVSEILNVAQQQAEGIRSSADEVVEKTVSHIVLQEEAAGSLVVKREVLNTQKTLLDSVYGLVLENIAELPEAFHKDAIVSLLRSSKDEIPAGRVSCNARDEATLKSVLTESEFANYTFGSVIDTEGGIIVESNDGLLQVDYSYRTFLNTVWESGLKDASDILFR